MVLKPNQEPGDVAQTAGLETVVTNTGSRLVLHSLM